MNYSVLFETALLTPVLQSAFGNADPLGQLGSMLIAQSVAANDTTFATLVKSASGGDR